MCGSRFLQTHGYSRPFRVFIGVGKPSILSGSPKGQSSHQAGTEGSVSGDGHVAPEKSNNGSDFMSRRVLEFSITSSKEGGLSPPCGQFETPQRLMMKQRFILRDLMKNDYWLSSVDLKDAYLSVPIAAPHKRLRFMWRGSATNFSVYHLA